MSNDSQVNNSQVNNSWNSHGKAIALAMGFFTRLPTWQLKEIADEDMGRALLYFPLVGLVVGLTTVVFGLSISEFVEYWHGDISVLQQALIGFLCFAVLIGVTGGLHLDGVADCADAWVGGLGDKERTLKIMKDPTCGPMGVFVLVLLLLLKAAAVVVLVINLEWLVLLLIPIISRSAGMALFIYTEYVRPRGLGQTFSNFSTKPECQWSLYIGLTAPLILAGTTLWLPMLLTGLLWWWIRQQSINRIGGFTGDVAGGVIELTEACMLVAAALLV